MENKLKSTLVIGISIIITALILGTAFKNRNENLDTISVVGLGTTDFISDEILWSGSFATKSFDIKEAYNKMISDQKIVADFFLSKGFKKEEFTFGAVQFNKRFREVRIENPENVYQTKYEQVFDGYEATQTITFSAKKNPDLMKRIEEVSSKTSELINSGIELTSNSIQYTYSNLPNLKHSLIEKASKDASERAQKIVNTADGSLGKLKSASMGVFQITGQGSTEEDSYGGNFDTYSKNKTARITVRLEYELD
ncbi:SIMPL domain-containing protein [Flavobacterium sp. HXWNR69]|uniref:SIMPL domain-containing protein n=1 Tax=Flavobacterium fragile TaxID=2949085 RepID=A0ABT0TI77_9FLAO|nr:SIMPL domain-containing protein [Flavobacterium sp. HXWNR69]MCL9770663.1 SIMPL domain-containing protein [Flavobacterium sp. HXWNR69]